MGQKKYRGLYLIALKIDAKFEGKLTFASKNDMNVANFHKPKNSDLVLEWQDLIKITKNSKQPDWPDAVSKFYFTLEINE